MAAAEAVAVHLGRALVRHAAWLACRVVLAYLAADIVDQASCQAFLALEACLVRVASSVADRQEIPVAAFAGQGLEALETVGLERGHLDNQRAAFAEAFVAA